MNNLRMGTDEVTGDEVYEILKRSEAKAWKSKLRKYRLTYKYDDTAQRRNPHHIHTMK